MDKPRIGFIGIGLMGHGIAKNLVTKGFPLTVRVNRNRAPLEDLLAAGVIQEVDSTDPGAGGDDRRRRRRAGWRPPHRPAAHLQ